jgi:NADPH-dependent 2,4-dienoyl-CoA reductase/sulfur reductase-like enzyme/rhodanese-related sulfurtransferase/two-component sensor histidine kinase
MSEEKSKLNKHGKGNKSDTHNTGTDPGKFFFQVGELKDEVARLLKERSEYLRISAHQMKSPLATITFSIDTLLGDYAGRLNSKQMRIVQSIRRSSKELQDLIMDILELEKFRTGKVVLERVNFSEVCVEAIDELREKIQEKNIKFGSDLPVMILITRGNRVGLRHAIYNLIENAIKYSHREGSIRFRVSYDEKDKTISAEIEDHGIGIPEESQKDIFEEFYRAPNARQFDRNGTGFGMVIVKQIIESSGGKISVWSRENEGTRVNLLLTLLEVKEPAPVVEGEQAYGKRVVVVGGVAAGPKAASRARRLDPNAKITVFEKENFLAYAGCALPYYISGQIRSQRELFKKAIRFESPTEFFRDVKGIEIKNLCEVTGIDRKNRSVEYREVLTDRVFQVPYDVLILATGSTPGVPPIPGVDLSNIFVLHGIADSENIKRRLNNEMARDIIIIGGGKIGVETAEALTATGGRITIVEKEPEILPFLDREMAALVRKHLERKGIRIITDEIVKAFTGEGKVEQVWLSNYKIPADLVILATGFKPNVKLAQEAGLTLGSTGAIEVNEYMQTSDPAIYAAGDCVQTINGISGKPFYLPLGSIANRQGRVAGSNASGYKVRFEATTGTIIIKVFDYHFAKTGLTEKEAEKFGFEPVSCYVPDYDRDQFLPESKMINIKITADEKTGRLLGVQIVGEGEVAKRIDVAATVIANKGKVEDVLSLDLGYAPFYSQAMDNIIVAAHVLENKMNGLFEGLGPTNAQQLLKVKEECACIDVRTPQEYEEERIPGTNLIPLENLRRRLDEIPREKDIMLVCDTGMRAYQASLILKANGFKRVRILEGGLRMWPFDISRE